MFNLNTEVIITILTSLTTIVVTLIVFRKELKLKRVEQENKKLKQENHSSKIELSCLKVLFESTFYHLLSQKIHDLFDNTKADRFLILFAINGKDTFKHVTVCYEAYKDSRYAGAISRYVRLSIDDSYKTLLKGIESSKYISLTTSSMPKDSLLYNIYSSESEKIKHSVVKFLGRKAVDADNDVLFYCSAATRQAKRFTNKELTNIRYNVDSIRAHIDDIKIEI